MLKTKLFKISAPLATFLTAALFQSAVSAETKAPASALTGGPTIKGVCILNRGDILTVAKVAQSANQGYRQAVETAQKEIDAERDVLQKDAKDLQDKKAKMKAEEFEKSEKGLQERLTALQAKANEKTQAIEATRQNVLQRISSEAQPVIEQVYKDRGCGLLLAREAVLAGNMGMDITGDVVSALDKKITELAFAKQEGVAIGAAR